MTKYNGWTNYETWLVNLWIDNDQGSQEYWRENALQVYLSAESDEHISKKRRATYDLADTLRTDIEENAPDMDGMYGDLMRSATSEVNWDEIARHMVDNLDLCECKDLGCGCLAQCENVAEYRLKRCDMEDISGTLMCERCYDDAMESGLFSVEAL